MADLSSKLEYPPLLGPGMHEMTLREVRQVCVDDFPLSTSRDDIMTQLEQMFDLFSQNGVACCVWLDGSFMTHKINPCDVDLVVCVPSDFADNCNSEQLAVLGDVASNLKRSNKCTRCDTFLCMVPQDSDPMFLQWIDRLDYWKRWFGHSRTGVPKGIATVQVGDVT